MLKAKDYNNKLIKKTIKRYEYDKPINYERFNKYFFESYEDDTKNQESLEENLKTTWVNAPIYKKHGFETEGIYISIPTGAYYIAQAMLAENHEDAFIHFERSAIFNVYRDNGEHYPIFESIYAGRQDLIIIILELLEYDLKNMIEINKDEPKTIKSIKSYKISPITYLAFFLAEKLGIENPILKGEYHLHYGEGNQGAGIYQKLVDNWDKDLRDIEQSYWDELCEYHLNRLGIPGTMIGKHIFEKDEFYKYNLMPMELLCVGIVRKQLGKDDFPEINHELFKTPLAKFPKTPTGYDLNLDVKYQMLKRTVEEKRALTEEEVIKLIQKDHGKDAKLIF